MDRAGSRGWPIEADRSRDGAEAARGERLWTRWRRRALTFPVLTTLAVAALALSPVWLVVGGVIDGARRKRLATLRFFTYLTLVLWCELLGLFSGLVLWLAFGGPFARGARWEAAHFAVQRRWASALFWAFARLYAVDIRVEGEAEARLGEGPVLVLSRHASVADTLLPATFISARFGVDLRYVLKRELLWDPCLDVFGQRLPNHFVDRGGSSSAREIEGVASLARGLQAGEGVLIYPEGTRFTPRKRARILARLEEKGEDALAEQARALEHTLPPRLGGTLALLDASPDADVVILGHVGLEKVTRLNNLFNGALIGTSLRLRYWRFDAASIPRDEAGRAAWLGERWEALDRWVSA